MKRSSVHLLLASVAVLALLSVLFITGSTQAAGWVAPLATPVALGHRIFLPLVGRDTSTPGWQDPLTAHDPNRWHMSDSENDMPPFLNAWRSHQVRFAAGMMQVRLEPCAEPDRECAGRPVKSGEYATNQKYGYGEFEITLRAADVPGTVTAFFLYGGPTHHEIDFEILGQDTGKVQANYYAGDDVGHEEMIDLHEALDQSFTTSDWHRYKIRWQPTQLAFFVDGRQVHAVDSAQNTLPSEPMHIIASLWACTGVDAWCRNFVDPRRPVEAYFKNLVYTPLSDTLSPTATPTSTPTSTQSLGSPQCRPIDSFNAIFGWNTWAGDGGQVSIGPTTGVVGQGMKIEAQTTSTWSWWFAKREIGQDWRGYDRLCLSYRQVSGGCSLAVALRDEDSETWYKTVPAPAQTTWTRGCFLFSQFGLDQWDVTGNRSLGLSLVRELRLRHVPQCVGNTNWEVDEVEICGSNTPMPTNTPTKTPSPIRTLPPTYTLTPMSTNTRSPTPTNTLIPPTRTPTRTLTPTNTPIPPTRTPTRTLTPTNTLIPPTRTPTRTLTPTNTPIPPTRTPTRTLTPTNTLIPSTRTPTRTLTPTNTLIPSTRTPTRMLTPTSTLIPPTSTPTSTPVGQIEDFEDLSDWGAWSGNGGTAGFESAPGVVGRGMRVWGNTPSIDSWWFSMKRVNRDWRSYSKVCFWHRVAPGTQTTTVAIRDADGEIWVGYVVGTYQHTSWTWTCVPFSSLTRDGYDHKGNGVLDLNYVQELRFRHAPQGREYVEYLVDELKVSS